MGPGLAIAATLIVVARPAAVWLCLWPFRFASNEIWFISWVGLRGAVPIVLALFPLMAGTPQAGLLFNIAFTVVLASLLIQGSTIGLMARWLGVALPEPGDEQRVRAVFRDFTLDPRASVASVCDFYGLPRPPAAQATLADWMAIELRRPPDRGRYRGARDRRSSSCAKSRAGASPPSASDWPTEQILQRCAAQA